MTLAIFIFINTGDTYINKNSTALDFIDNANY